MADSRNEGGEYGYALKSNLTICIVGQCDDGGYATATDACLGKKGHESVENRQ